MSASFQLIAACIPLEGSFANYALNIQFCKIRSTRGLCKTLNWSYIKIIRVMEKQKQHSQTNLKIVMVLKRNILFFSSSIPSFLFIVFVKFEHKKIKYI